MGKKKEKKKVHENVWVVSYGDVELHVIAWSDDRQIANEYADNYANIDGIEAEKVSIGKMLKEDLFDEYTDVSGLELVYVGRQLYVPQRYSQIYLENETYLREQCDSARTFLTRMKESDMTPKKYQKAIEKTIDFMEAYFLYESRELMTEEQCNEILSMKKQFKERV